MADVLNFDCSNFSRRFDLNAGESRSVVSICIRPLELDVVDLDYSNLSCGLF